MHAKVGGVSKTNCLKGRCRIQLHVLVHCPALRVGGEEKFLTTYKRLVLASTLEANARRDDIGRKKHKICNLKSNYQLGVVIVPCARTRVTQPMRNNLDAKL
jgi:hypothetical protein